MEGGGWEGRRVEGFRERDGGEGWGDVDVTLTPHSTHSNSFMHKYTRTHVHAHTHTRFAKWIFQRMFNHQLGLSKNNYSLHSREFTFVVFDFYNKL